MFYTGSGQSARIARYVIDILDEGWMIENILGALEYLGVPFNWAEKGDVSADDAAERSNDAIVTFRRYPVLIGSIIPYATSATPDDTLFCDGATYSRVDYPELYDVLDTIYIVDVDSFSVPDLRGRTVLGTGSGSGLTARAMADVGGEETHQLSEAEMPTHDHSSPPHSHFYDKAIANLDLEAPGAPDILGLGQPFVPTVTDSVAATIDSAGGDESHNNMPPFHALRYCIVAR